MSIAGAVLAQGQNKAAVFPIHPDAILKMIRDVEPPIPSEMDMSRPSHDVWSLGPLALGAAVNTESIDGCLFRVADKQSAIGECHTGGFLKCIRFDALTPRRSQRCTAGALSAGQKRTQGQKNGGENNDENGHWARHHVICLGSPLLWEALLPESL